MFKLPKKLGQQSGFTLIEVMIIGAVLAVLMVGFASFMFQQSKQQRNQEVQQNANQLKNNLVEAASQPDTVSNTEQAHF